MNIARWFHAVSISTRSTTPTGRELQQKPWTVVHASLRCSLEQTTSRRRELLLGELAQAEFVLECSGGTTVQEGDLVTVLSGPGVTVGAKYIVESILSDTQRFAGPTTKVLGLVAVARSSI